MPGRILPTSLLRIQGMHQLQDLFLTLLCSLYLAHMERTQLAGVLDGPLPPPSGPAHGAAGAAGTAGTAGQESVVVLTGGNAAALSPATVLSLGGAEGGAGESSGSRGLLSELARAAGSWMTPIQKPQQGQPSKAAGAHTRTPFSANTTERGSRQRSTQGCAGGNSASCDRPAGDLLLLPAGAAPAAGTAAAAALAAASIGKGAASPADAACGRRQAGAAAASGPAQSSPQSTAGPCQGLQQAQETGHAQGAQHARQAQQLGCSRLALHAGSLLLRLVDDFLLITAVPAVAQGFASRMLDGTQACAFERGSAAGRQGCDSAQRMRSLEGPGSRSRPCCWLIQPYRACCGPAKSTCISFVPPAGFPSHNVHVNPDKTKLSFALQLPAAGPPNPAACGPAGAAAAAAPLAAGSARSESGAAPAAASRGTEVVPATVWRSADEATFVKWCGLLINVATLELQGDYTRCPPTSSLMS